MSVKLLVIGLGILLLIGLIWLLPLEARFSFRKDWSETEISIDIGPVFRLTPFKWGRYYRKRRFGSLLDPLYKQTLHWLRKRAAETGPPALPAAETEGRTDLAEFRSKLMDMAEYAKGVIRLIGNKRIKRFRGVRWVTEVGLFNAMETALAAGICWGVKGGLLSALQQATGKLIREPEIRVFPNFQKTGWRTELLVIIETRLGEMLLDGWRLSRLNRVKPARTATQSPSKRNIQLSPLSAIKAHGKAGPHTKAEPHLK